MVMKFGPSVMEPCTPYWTQFDRKKILNNYDDHACIPSNIRWKEK